MWRREGVEEVRERKWGEEGERERERKKGEYESVLTSQGSPIYYWVFLRSSKMVIKFRWIYNQNSDCY